MSRQCIAWGRYGVPCKNSTTNPNACCWRHQDPETVRLATMLETERKAAG